MPGAPSRGNESEAEAGAVGHEAPPVFTLKHFPSIPAHIRLREVVRAFVWGEGIEEPPTVAQRASRVRSAARAARRLVAVICEQGWTRFTSREVLRLNWAGLGTAAALDPALALLEEGDCIRAVAVPSNPGGGRRSRLFAVNPAFLGA